MKTLIVLTGPQGAGNHLFSKLFATNKTVVGWDSLLKKYWIGHDQEPFSKYWLNPNLIHSENWDDKVYVTSISCPYINNGDITIPKYKETISAFLENGFTVKIVIIGRDQNILSYQQSRVRGNITKSLFLRELPKLVKYSPIFVSTELVYLYGYTYVKSIFSNLGIQEAADEAEINDILIEDPNFKYFNEITKQQLDTEVAIASRKR